MHSRHARDRDQNQLRRSLSALSMSLRRTADAPRPAEPRFVSYDQLRQPDGAIVGRKKVILMSGGCSVPTCTMCPFTNENNYGLGSETQSLLHQVSHVLTRSPDEPAYDVLALYNDGSFFAPREIPRDAQLVIAEYVAKAGVRRLVVESLPQFVTPAVLAPFVDALRGVELEVGIGLQSSDDLVRETLVNTRISRTAFERALLTMSELGVHPKIYLMVKPPFLTDAEAITDVVSSVEYVRALGIQGVTLCPTRVSPNTVAWRLWESGAYQPPNLWTIVDTVRRIHDATQVRVACINLRGSDFESVFPDSCPACADHVVDSLIRYSETGDVADLPDDCGCRPMIEATALDHAAIVARSLELLARSSSDERVIA
ncbi:MULTISPECIES: hypothetical protein [Frankia]|uniref:hypothetical protein n=1 Tax=Frankia TaxID=1854 RepID=UPI00041F3C52|nr:MULTISPECIES: hypothetical protein [Frankia]OHV51759.1 hypothetical protein CgIS1_18090 [Frankia sp. CgIS1]